MSDYIPTTDQIRRSYFPPSHDKAEFDRWLKHIKAEAWAEGFDAGERDVWAHEHHPDGFDSDCIRNPYRGDKQK